MEKDRFLFLDALRGLAALFVVYFHEPFLPFQPYRAYLAVDIFFLLSGFVIGFAYDGRLVSGKMTILQFIRVRLIRFYPMYFLSLLLAYGLFLVGSQERGVSDSGFFVTLFLPTLVFLPNFLPGNPNIFPLNTPYWSLFLELGVNFLYAATRRWLTNRVLLAVVLLSGAGFALETFVARNSGLGWSWTVPSLVGGTCRATFGIFFGLLIQRHYGPITRFLGDRIPPWVSLVLAATMLMLPSVHGFDLAINLLEVFVVFPLIVVIASRTKATRWGPFLAAIGAASYPIYVFHQPLWDLGTRVLLALGWDRTSEVFGWSGGAFLLVLVFTLAVFLERRVDIPIRTWLTRRLGRPQEPKKA